MSERRRVNSGTFAAANRRNVMKKIVILLLGLMVLGTVLFVVLRRGGASNEYARYLPQETVMSLNLTHLGAVTDTFTTTALGRFLAKDTVHAIISEAGGGAKEIADYDRTFDGVAGVMTNPAFRAVFGEDAAVALLAPEQGGLGSTPLEVLRSSLVVVARTSVAGAVDLFGRMLGKKANITREVIDDLELTKLVLESGDVLFGYTEGKMVFLAYSPAAIKRCLLAADKSGKRLEDATPFTQARDFWQTATPEQTYARLYINPPRLETLLRDADKPEIKQAAEMLQGMDGFASLTYSTAQGLESRARSTYRYEQLHPVVKSAVDAATRPNPTLFLLKEKTLAYNWASALRPELITRTLAENDLPRQQIDASLRKELGVSLEELARAFGPQYGGVLEDIVRAALFPLPKLTLFIGLHDRAIAEKVVNGLRAKIAENGMIREEQEQVAGHTIYCWPLLPDKDAQPALAMTEHMLYLATSKQAVREILESKAQPDALAAAVATQLGPLGEEVGRANTGSLVLYPQRMAKQTGETLDWVAGILAKTKNITLSRLNQELVQLMQSTEVLTATSTMGREQADWSMSLRKAAASSPPSAGK